MITIQHVATLSLSCIGHNKYHCDCRIYGAYLLMYVCMMAACYLCTLFSFIRQPVPVCDS